MLPQTVRIDNHPNLLRDTSSMGVVNTDARGLQASRLQRESVIGLRKEFEKTKEELKALKRDVQFLLAERTK